MHEEIIKNKYLTGKGTVRYRYLMIPVPPFSALLGRIAGTGLRHADVAHEMGLNPTAFSAILNGRRKAPADFEAQCERALLEALKARAKQASKQLREEQAKQRELGGAV